MSRGALARFAPAALLATVASVQIGLAHSVQLSPWLGGGFGMFSSTDTWSRRHLHAFALRTGLRRELELPADGLRDAMRATALPSDANLRALARWLAALPSPDDGALEAIEIQVWGVRYAKGLAPEGVLLRGARIEAGEL